ncbi:MBL fold metallo-hydrolase [candidate division KSB1 bacterium]|nr:MBL fold metallo-hydrolase [candidate division KSB1 bacterium]
MNLDAIIVGPIEVNCFIITCSTTNHAAIVDPGDDAEALLDIIRAKSLALTYILLTHGHFDHIGAVAALQKVTGAEVLMHQADEFLIRTAGLQARSFGLPAPEVFNADRFIANGDEIIFGELRCSVIATPGHSPGGVCYLFENDIFVGDTLFYGGIGRTDLPAGDYGQIMRSIKDKLFTLPDDMQVHCGHGPLTTIGREKRYNPFIQ